MHETRRRSRSFGYYVVKTMRFTGWLLLAMMVLYIVSGYALVPEFGCDRLMSTRTAEALHIAWKLDRLLVPVFAVHSFGAMYLAFRRWGWIKTRRKT